MPKVGGRRKKQRSHKQIDENNQQNTPKAFVFKKGKCSESCKQFALDFRKCFYPNTAMKLQDMNKLSIKSYVKAAKYYSVSHLIAFQQIKQKTFARFIKVGGGEMLFRVINYCRMKDVLKNGGQPFSFSLNQPLIVLNNFTENNQMRQIGRSIQQMFPSIDLQKINLSNIKRVLSFTYQPNKKCIYFRHYKIIINEKYQNNSFKQFSQHAQKDLSNYRSFSQYLNRFTNFQEQNNNNKGKQTNEHQRRVKLVEIGPKMKLKFLVFKAGVGKVWQEQGEQKEHEEGMKDEKVEKEHEGQSWEAQHSDRRIEEMEGEQQQGSQQFATQNKNKKENSKKKTKE